MALDALPDEDFSSHKIGSACATAAQAFPICSADMHCTDLKEEPSSLCGEPSHPLLQTLQRRAHYTCAISSSARQALPLTSKSQRPSLTKCHHLFPQTGLLRQWHSAQTQAVRTLTKGQTVQTLTKWWEQPDTVRWQSHRSKPEGKVPLQKPFSTSQAKRAPIGLFLSTLSLNVNSTGIRFI